MKTKNLLISLAFLLFSLTACQKEPVSAVDPLPFPMDVNKDRSVAPGDDFFQFCNGTWLSQTPIPDHTPTGGLYASTPAMDSRLEELKKSNPQIGHFFRLKDEMFDHEAASLEYIRQQKEAIKKPTSPEEAFRTIGEMLKDGVPTMVQAGLITLDGKIIIYLVPFTPSVVKSGEMVPATKADNPTPLQWIAEGLGVEISQVYYDPALDEELSTLDVDDLYEYMLGGWDDYELYAKPTGFDPDFLDATARNLINYELSYYFVQAYVPASIKEKYLDLTRMVRDTFRERLEKVDWMSETTRSNALKKLDAMKLMVAYPDQWHMDCIPDITGCKTFVEVAHRLGTANTLLITKLAGSEDLFTQMLLTYSKNATGQYTQFDLLLSNAMYFEDLNGIAIYPAFMLPPIVKENVTSARDFAVFTAIGHEITHGFDSNGSKYDERGNVRNWWTVADQMAFEDRQQKLIRCYEHLPLDPAGHPGVYCNGTRTLGENIADLGGFLTVLDAYKKYLTNNGFTGETYKEQLRKLYECYADIWCVQYSDRYWPIFISQDVHSVARARVNGVVMNTDLWYDLYNVTRNNILYLSPEQRTYIW
jgi:predicted metalloendopeptidase